MAKQLGRISSNITEWWFARVLRRPRLTVAAVALATAAIAAFTASHFAINTDLTDMISGTLPFRVIEKDFQQALPELSDAVTIVIDAPTPELALQSQQRLAQKLEQATDLFQTVFLPGGDEFFRQNGLLYLSVAELTELSDSLAEVQPFLAVLGDNSNLVSLAAVLNLVVTHADEYIKSSARIPLLFDRLSAAFESAAAGSSCHLSWQELIIDKKPSPAELRKFIIARPRLDYSALYPAQPALAAIRSAARQMGLTPENGVRVRITGGLAINQADLESIENGIGMAGLWSLLLVSVVLYIGVRSIRLVLLSLAALITGLVWTLGFAIGCIGSLNLISIAFAVLFIGLGIDTSIQICLHYQEERNRMHSNAEAITRSARGISGALLLCAITTAAGFFAFVPTDYVGASELGIISGAGMLINLLINLTLLPALITLMPERREQLPASRIGAPLARLPQRVPGIITVAAAALALAAAAVAPSAFFDVNPLNLSNPDAEAVKLARELSGDTTAAPWTISVLTGSLAEARALKAALQQRNEVKETLSIDDFVPDRQPEKLDIISDLAFFMPVRAPQPVDREATRADKVAALAELEASLQDALLRAPQNNQAYVRSLQRLHQAVSALLQQIGDPQRQDGAAIIRRLEITLLDSLTAVIGHLNGLLQARQFGIRDLPERLRNRYSTVDGRYRVEVFPREDISSRPALVRFVTAVRAVAPAATDAPVTILESGNAIAGAFKKATLYALLSITVLLIIMLRRPADVVLVLVPLLLAVVYTAASSALLHIPFNYANVIIVPLILGIGVDYGIHIVYHYRGGGGGGAPGTVARQSCTSRAVLFSALTTIVSFGSLSFLSHRGTASMGMLLTISVFFIIVCSLLILPALLAFVDRHAAKTRNFTNKIALFKKRLLRK